MIQLSVVGEVVEPSPQGRLKMRKLMMAMPMLFLAVAVHAAPKQIRHIATAAPRAVGRTVENRVTFKDHGLANGCAAGVEGRSCDPLVHFVQRPQAKQA
jgi:hypothetical protein